MDGDCLAITSWAMPPGSSYPRGFLYAWKRMPVLRVGRNRQKGRGQAPVQILPQIVQGVDLDGDVVDEAGPGTVQENGQPDAQRRQAQGHNRLGRHIHEDGLRLEDEDIRRGVRDTEKGHAVGEMLDRRGAGPGQRGRVLPARRREEAEGRFKEPGRHRLRSRFLRQPDRHRGREGPHHLRGLHQDLRRAY